MSKKSSSMSLQGFHMKHTMAIKMKNQMADHQLSILDREIAEKQVNIKKMNDELNNAINVS